MTCRVSLLQDGRPKNPVTCADCGARDLDVFYTSKEQDYHLCPACFQASVARRTVKEAETAQ
jgi:hypothetical protein